MTDHPIVHKHSGFDHRCVVLCNPACLPCRASELNNKWGCGLLGAGITCAQ